VDGKQARRLAASSPLGQLFDHGCDAVCAALSGVFVSALCQTGATWLALAVFLMHIVPFFVSNWEETQTGMMRFGAIGVTEGQFLIIFIMLLSAVTGSWIWSYKFVVLGHSLRVVHFFVGVGLFGLIFAMWDTAVVVRRYWASNPTVDSTKGKWALAQFFLLVGLGTAWICATYHTVFQTHPALIFLTIGFLFCYLVSRLIISKVTHGPYAKVFPVLYPFPLILAHALCTQCTGRPVIVHPLYVAVAYFALVMAVYLHFIHGAITEITTFLGIQCFHLPKPSAAPVASSTDSRPKVQ